MSSSNYKPTSSSQDCLLSRSNSLQSNHSSYFLTNTSHISFPPTPPQSNYNSPLHHHSNHHSQTTPPPTRTASRNDIFSLSLPQPNPFITPLNKTHSHLLQKSSYNQLDLNRLKTHLHLRINSSPSATLGRGTHGTVYLALSSTHHNQDDHQSKSWKLCAAKVSHDISGSLKETLALERLRPKEFLTNLHSRHPSNFIIAWLGLKEENECEWIRSTEETFKQSKRSSTQSLIPSIVLALEYCPAGDLFKFVQKSTNLRPEDHLEDKRFHVNRSRWLKWSREISEALAWCKQCHVLVGDLKPQNILLTSQLEIRLSDFNCSTLLSAEESKYGLGLIDPQGTGTSVYAAPELVRPPPSPCSYPADIFAFGITMYFLITGREPYRGIQSAVERMLLISCGAFWEHESGIRWRMLEDGQSLTRSSSRSKQINLAKSASSISAEPNQYQSNQSVVSGNTIEALFGCKLDIGNSDESFTPFEETAPVSSDDDDTNRFQFYNDGSPKIRHLNGHEFVDERIMKLISKMCSPLASDRPQIEQVVQELNSL